MSVISNHLLQSIDIYLCAEMHNENNAVVFEFTCRLVWGYRAYQFMFQNIAYNMAYKL